MSSKAKESWNVARKKWHIRAIRGGKWWRERGQKSLSAIPHLFTLLNLAFGVGSIMLTMAGDLRLAALMIVGSLAADGLDGRLARMLRADGEFGKELDSLADVVAFGTAPALLMYKGSLYQLGYYGILIAVLFPMCGALRLARFNIIKTSGFFMGVPITAAGTFLSCLMFYTVQANTAEPVPYLVAAITLLLAYLMISTIPYPDLKKFRKGTQIRLLPPLGPLLAIAAVLAATRWNPWSIVVLPLTAYVVLGPWLLLLRQWSEKVQPWLAGAGRH